MKLEQYKILNSKDYGEYQDTHLHEGKYIDLHLKITEKRRTQLGGRYADPKIKNAAWCVFHNYKTNITYIPDFFAVDFLKLINFEVKP